MKEFAAAEWQRAERALDSARQIVPGDPDSAASRAYYAAFHALTALFAMRGQMFSKHSAIRAAMHRDLVQTGLLAADRGRDYDFLMDLRETGDYGGLMQVTPENAQAAVDKAASFMNALISLQSQLR
jgi:uncharacterized protein (UPF0332 family)